MRSNNITRKKNNRDETPRFRKGVWHVIYYIANTFISTCCTHIMINDYLDTYLNAIPSNTFLTFTISIFQKRNQIFNFASSLNKSSNITTYTSTYESFKLPHYCDVIHVNLSVYFQNH